MFDLENDIYEPYRKPNNKLLYIDKHSNHPLNILKQLPKSIEKRIFETSSNIDVFNRSIKIYNDGLHESNFREALKFVIPAPKNNDENQKRKRKRNIIWFNPPYSKNVKTNIGKTFLQLLSKHFPKDLKMHKIFNKNTAKINYSCMNNISSILSTHNKNILNPKQTSFGCNCRNKDNCPFDGECLTPNIITVQILPQIMTINFTRVHQKQLLKNTTVIIFVSLNMSNTNMLLNLLSTSGSLKTVISIAVLSGRLLQKYMVMLTIIM